MTAPGRDDALLRFRLELVDQLEQARRSDKAVKTVLRLAMRLFDAPEGCVAVVAPGRPVEPRFRVERRGGRFHPDLLLDLGAARRPKLPPDVMAAPLPRRGRVWGHLVLAREAPPFDLGERRDLGLAAAFAARQLQRIDRQRAAEVRERIDRKILEQLRPADLFYQVLDGLRSLARYDHSAAVLIFDAGASVLRLAAEQIAWRKGKSQRVGAQVPVDDEALAVLEGGEVHLLRRPEGEAWSAADDDGGAILAARLAAGGALSLDDGERPARALLVAPLVARDRLLGVLEIASCHPDSLGPWEMDLVSRMLPQAAVAVANLDRAASLEQGLLAAERKHVMAELARGVSHDVNNALGAVLPLVQQMAADLRAGAADPATLIDDLAQVESSVQVCRRIFGGMLAFAQGSRGHPTQADVGQAVRSALSVLEEGLRRATIRLQLALDEPLPPVRGTRGDLEQVVLNLAGNARDAMPGGGLLTVRARLQGQQVVLAISDTGRGIAPSDLPRVSEPFFTTKRHGKGLGLSICRSIVWTMGGTMTIDSAPERGTTVTVSLPAAQADAPDAAAARPGDDRS